MSNVTAPTPAPAPGPDKDLEAIIEALRDIQTEGQAWKLAEALLVKVPTGVKGFDEIIDKATTAGVVGKLSANTLRAYRDAAFHWPPDQRIPNVSFSAHREAMNLPNGVTDQRKLLEELAKNLGSGKVSVSSVRRAVQVKRGKPVTTRGAGGGRGGSGTTPNPTVTPAVDVLADIKDGGGKVIGAIVPSTTEPDLDKLQAGLNKILAHVERLKMKASRAKSTAAAQKATGSAVKSPEAPTAPPAKKAGDLRGM